MVNFKNLLAGFVGTVAVVAALVSVVPYASAQTLVDAEFDDALSWAYDAGLTRYNTTDAFMPYANLTREQAAKFFAAMGVETLCLEADATASCDFSDVPADPTLDEYVVLACQLGLVKGSNGMYFPTDSLTKAQAITILIRALNAAEGNDPLLDETGTPWYSSYFSVAQTAGITNETDVMAIDRPVTRYEVLLMLYRAANSVELTCSEDVDLTDLLADLFGDDENTTDDMDEDEDTNDTVTVSDGMVMASLSSSTPAGDTVPGLANIEVATFDFMADGDDVMLQTVVLERFGLGSDDAVDEVTLLVDGEVVSKSRSFNSDDQATLSLNPEVMLPAGETVEVTVLATIGDAEGVDGASNQEFAIGLADFETNGDEDKDNLPVVANEFEVGGVNAAEVTVSEDGNLSDVELGETGAEIASFEIDNNSDNAVYITSITLEDDESEIEDSFENFVLEHNGNEVAMVASVTDKYLTFTLDTPVMIDENESEDFKVFADVTGGAGEQVNLIIDESIYVRGYDERYGYGLAITATYTPAAISINAGELTFVELDLDPDQLRADREDFVIAAFDVNVNAGQDLSLEDIEFDITAVGTLGTSTNPLVNDLYDHFDEVQLVVTVDGNRRTYDLDDVAGTRASNFISVGDDDLGIFLPSWSDIVISLEVDSVSQIPSWSFSDTFRVSLDVVNDVKIIENDDDEEVTDIVPSSITFDTIEFVDSTVDVNSINLTDVDVVKGAENVDVVKFEVETDDISGVYVQWFVFEGTVNGTTDINQDYINALRIWMRTSAGYELLEAEGGFDINNGLVTLDDFDEVFIPASSTQEFLLTVDVAENDLIAGDVFAFVLVDSDIEDDDNVQLCDLGSVIAPCAADSTREVTITDSGELDVSVELSEDEIDDEVYVLGGSDADEAPYVAAFEFTARNEAIEIEDLILTATVNGGGDFDQAVAEVVLFDEDGNVIDSETVSSTTVEFNDINLVIEEGSQFVFVKVVTDIIGDNENGDVAFDVTFNVAIDNADGVDSGDEVTGANLTYEGAAGTETDESLEFSIVPVKFSGVEFVTSAAGTSVDTTTTDGNDVNIAILRLTADNWDNTNRFDGSDLEAVVKALTFETSNTADVSNYEIRRVGNGSTSYFTGSVSGNEVTFTFPTTATNTVEFDAGEVGYYLVRADISAGTNTTVRLTLDNLNGGGSYDPIVYSPSDLLTEEYTELRVGDEFVESQNVTVNNG